jgi:hypothetical protein
MAFTAVDYELFHEEILKGDRQININYKNKKLNVDATSSQQTFILLAKFGKMALEHKKTTLDALRQNMELHIKLMDSVISVNRAAASNISPVANLINLANFLVSSVNLAAMLTTLGDMQAEYRILARKPLIMFISEILQGTEDLANQNLTTAYNTLQDAYIIPDHIH